MHNNYNTKIAIGIQARSTSKRLPRKIHMVLTHRTILDHVIKSARDAAIYMNRFAQKRISVYLLVPFDDEIIFKRNEFEIPIIEGPEDDVLARYVSLAKKTKADYYCRITADCPLLPHYVISKLITLASVNDYDYVSNVDERCRTSPDGNDCEVFSKKLLNWLDENAKGTDREHVTTLARRDPPDWIRHGTVINFQDSSGEKFSVDTMEDLDSVRERLHRVEIKYDTAVEIFGRQSVHRF